jgi:hypothetical protein
MTWENYPEAVVSHDSDRGGRGKPADHRRRRAVSEPDRAAPYGIVTAQNPNGRDRSDVANVKADGSFDAVT